MLNDMEAVAISNKHTNFNGIYAPANVLNVTTHNNENKNKIVISRGTVQRLKS